MFCVGKIKGLLAVALALTVLTAQYAVSAADDKTLAERLEISGDDNASSERLPYYSETAGELSGKTGSKGYYVTADSYSDFAGEKPQSGENGSVIFTESTELITWEIGIEEEGIYNLQISYRGVSDSVQSPQRSLYIDGEQTFYEESVFTLRKAWRDESSQRINALGDEVRVNSQEINCTFTVRLCDNWGKHSEPLRFKLAAGKHTVSFGYISQDAEIISVGFVPYETIKSYSEVNTEYTASYAENTIRFEAEDYKHIAYKNDATISLSSDGDPCVSPYTARNVKLNMIGGSSWCSGGQEIEWKFEVPKDGLYKINIRALQNYSDALPVYRRIKINGKVPFSELNAYSFDYKKIWNSEVLCKDDGEPMLFELYAGVNTISMSAVLGGYAEISEKLIDTARMLSSLVFDITMVTGNNPDPNYDYGLDDEIPDLITGLTKIRDNISECESAIASISNKRSAMKNNLQRIVKEIDALIKEPSDIVRRMNDLNSAITDMSDYSTSLQCGYLGIDYIELLPPDAEVKNSKSGFFERARATLANLIVSFSKNYNAIGSVDANSEGAETLDVWVCLGKEWGQILKEAVDADFSPRNNVNVKINLLPSGSVTSTINPLLLALGAGRGPDVVLGLTYNYPVEYAMRSALYDLSRFDDFKQVTERFQEALMVPYEFEGGVYALPQTMSFRAIYYRTDIFENLGLTVPDTWEELYNKLLPALNQNNMTMYIPQIIDPFVYQMGASYYRDEGTLSNLDTAESFTAFDEFCKLYTDYGIPVSEDFYSRFRTGEVPIGMTDASMYLKFSYAAPEIAGCWAMAPIPGHIKEDGTVDRSNSGLAVDSCVIIQDCENPHTAWEFLKWWTDAETQKNYSAQVESRLGSTARWLSANKEAFKSLSWSRQDKLAIESAFNWAVETPVVRGGYFTNRHLVNAINRVVVQRESPRSSLEEAVEAINKELKRRQKKS